MKPPPWCSFSEDHHHHHRVLSLILLLIVVSSSSSISPVFECTAIFAVMSGGGGGGEGRGGGTSQNHQACAACKYQRKRCAADCPLAPYFPADKPETFRNVHRLFGVRKLKEILDMVEPHQRVEAMKSVIYEADMRAKFPVDGCWGVTQQLHSQLQQAMEELVLVTTHLAAFNSKYQIPNPHEYYYSHHQHHHRHPQYYYSNSSSWPSSSSASHDHQLLQISAGRVRPPPPPPPPRPPTMPTTIDQYANGRFKGVYLDDHDHGHVVKPALRVHVQDPINYYSHNNNIPMINVVDQLPVNLASSSSQGLPIPKQQQQILDANSHDDTTPFETTADDHDEKQLFLWNQVLNHRSRVQQHRPTEAYEIARRQVME